MLENYDFSWSKSDTSRTTMTENILHWYSLGPEWRALASYASFCWGNQYCSWGGVSICIEKALFFNQSLSRSLIGKKIYPEKSGTRRKRLPELSPPQGPLHPARSGSTSPGIRPKCWSFIYSSPTVTIPNSFTFPPPPFVVLRSRATSVTCGVGQVITISRSRQLTSIAYEVKSIIRTR